MNETKRKSLRDAILHLNRVIFLVEGVCDKEEDALESCPENLQESERYFSMEAAIDHMHDALEDLDAAKEHIESAIR